MATVTAIPDAAAVDPVGFLAGGGAVAAHMRDRDWSESGLGPPAGWPQSLKTTTAILLRSPVPMVLLWGADGIMIYNDAYSGFAGARHPTLLGSRVREGWAEIADFNDNVMRVGLAGGTLAYRDQELTLHRHGAPEQVFMDLDYSPVLDESGTPAGVLAIVIETTDRIVAQRRQAIAEAQVRAERDRVQDVLGNMGEAFLLLDHDFRIVDMNAEALRMEDRPREAIIGLTHWEAHPGAAPELGALYRRAMAERVGVALEHRYDWPDGRISWIDMRAYPVAAGLAVFYRDVSDRRLADEQLRAQAHALETLNHTGAALSAELDLERVVQMLVEAGVALTGARFGAYFHNVMDESGERLHLYTLAGAERADFEQLGRPRATAIFGPTFRNEGTIRSDDILLDPRYGQNAPHGGMPTGHLPVRSYLAVSVVSRGGAVLGGLLFGHPEPARFSERHESLITGLAGQAAIAIDNARLFGQVQEARETLEARVQERTAELADAHEALRQAQKMEAVGQLTGGIAHDFNNLLTGIIGSLDLIERKIQAGRTGELDRHLAVATTSANRAAALTHRLLAFSRRQPLDARPVDANQLVTSLDELLRRTLGESIQLEMVTAAGLWQTLCDPHQLESALLNLAINARDAMPDGGRLTVETCNAHLDDAYAARDRDVRPGQYICICVSDTGHGMDKATMERAFEPFFTTKPIGQGTGLGLSMIYGFARQSDGYARIESEPGRGTTIKLYLPRHQGSEDSAADVAAAAPAEAVASGDDVVLVVEDEAAVRELVVEVLGDLGFATLEAVDGPAGLAVLEGDARIDLLVTDIGLPGMNGRQLADAARARRPELRVLFMTGYAENAAINGGFLDPGMALITKPFAVDALTAKLRQVLDRG